MLKRKRMGVVLGLAAACVVAGIAVPAFGQGRYPPFPIDGSSGAASTSPTPSAAPSEFFNPGRGSGGSGGSSSSTSSGSSSANTVDDPKCDLATCLRFAGEVGDEFVVGRVEELGDLRVAALSGCCESFAKVDVYMESERVFLGTVRASSDGSYFGQFTIPASIKAGTHHIIADIEGCGELKAAIQVLDPDAVNVLGTTTRNLSGVSDVGGGGILPRTGGDIMKVLFWALVLVAFGTLLIVVTRRAAFGRADGGALRAAGPIAALPAPDVPFVDTSRFMPYRSAPGQRLNARGSRTTPSVRPRSAWDRGPRNTSPS